MFERFKSLPQLWRTGRLALRLLRDPRAPMAAKFLLGATVIYLLSPLDVVPDWIPVFGQADDIVVLLTGLNLFLKACPSWLVSEHEDEISGHRDSRDDSRRSWRSDRDFREPAGAGAGGGPTIDGQYRRMA
jgi:uncharacterized membrane protein YkvA (DUF1232 family)